MTQAAPPNDAMEDESNNECKYVEINAFGMFNKTDSMLSDSMISLASSVNSSTDPRDDNIGLFADIVRTENDLAGFSIAWLIGFVIITILRIMGHQDVNEAYWWWIVSIPILVSCLTWMFSYVITKYRKPYSKESMRSLVFVLPFLCKIGIAALFFWRMFYSSGGIKHRNRHNDSYSGWCDCSMLVIWMSLILSGITTEIIITTVMINSSQNLIPKIPRKVDIFLFITRPLLWVYNRLIVMFITFYCYYYAFGIGPLCSRQCAVDEVSNVASIGVSILILPFRTPLYLFKWKPFNLDDSTYSNAHHIVYAVIQQFLIFTTVLDLLMDIWSISQIQNRFEVQTLRKLSNSIVGLSSVKGKEERNKAVAMPPIREDIEMDGAHDDVPESDRRVMDQMQADLEKLMSVKNLNLTDQNTKKTNEAGDEHPAHHDPSHDEL